MTDSIQKKIRYQAYLNRENQFRHHRYDEELLQYQLIRDGKVAEAVTAAKKMFSSGLTGALSADPLREKKYLFVASTTLATRFAIQGGMSEEQAYTTSDLFIQEMDKAKDIPAVVSLQGQMIEAFARGVASSFKQSVYQLPLIRCIEYIEDHLHERITLAQLAEAVGYSSNYISSLFRSQLEIGPTDYIAAKKIEVAQNMLASGDFSLFQVSEILAFSSQSYFTKIFKKYAGLTPKDYLKTFPADAIH